ncbi:hypothetical protein PUR61_00135 [Streptomyces sp. BE20]|uniref:hypothetical protein n=1 Tax=unclassified Streptomyces TaxID=2593676 RepID=UPI002E792619|nr:MULTISPECIES: hypothetical protein [unclassified Streptomyces]MED7947428.1 hypothetical protein [Streptomyces sp. BE303]MEE1820630.1 hypothetical protein [Streptomyces sp. BE20]
MGCQDLDLMNRAKARGTRVVRASQQAPFAIRNTDADKVRHTGSPLSWHDMWQQNIRRTEENLRAGRLTVNHGRTPVQVLLNFTRSVEV